MAFLVSTRGMRRMQGHVGVRWRGGKLLQHVSGPGLRLKVPILDLYSPIQVTLQAQTPFFT